MQATKPTKKKVNKTEQILNGNWLNNSDLFIKILQYYKVLTPQSNDICRALDTLKTKLTEIKSQQGDQSIFIPMLVDVVKKDFSSQNHYTGMRIEKSGAQYKVTYIDLWVI